MLDCIFITMNMIMDFGIKTYRITSLPQAEFYIADFITDEEEFLL